MLMFNCVTLCYTSKAIDVEDGGGGGEGGGGGGGGGGGETPGGV